MQGKEGKAGADGAVAGFTESASEVGFNALGETSKPTRILSKNLPAGSFIITGTVMALGTQLGTNGEGGNAKTTYVDVSCTLTDTPEKGASASNNAFGSGLTDIPIVSSGLGIGTLPMN